LGRVRKLADIRKSAKADSQQPILLSGAIGTYIGGRVTDRLVKTRGLKIGRSLGVVTLPLSAALLIAAALAPNPITAAVLLALTLGVADLCVSSCWAICHDVGGERAGTVTAGTVIARAAGAGGRRPAYRLVAGDVAHDRVHLRERDVDGGAGRCHGADDRNQPPAPRPSQ